MLLRRNSLGASNLAKARNPGTLMKMNPSQEKTCKFIKAKNLQLYYK